MKSIVINRFAKLAIISDCIHMRNESGEAVTDNHIYCRQMQELAKYFEQTIIVCPFVEFEKGSSASVYRSSSIKFIELPNAGGQSLSEKWRLVKTIPAWLKSFKQAWSIANVFYLRMPNNLNIPGYFYFKLKGARTFATYTGTWDNYENEPATYRFQKWLLKNFFKGPVWIYSEKDITKKHLFKGISPSYSEAEWLEELDQVEKRIEGYKVQPLLKPTFITVGALVPNKNQLYILETCKNLRTKGFDFYWYIVGDGYMKGNMAAFIRENNLENNVCLTGKKNYTQLRQLYRQSDFIVQATLVEGFGKAPIEAMFHGVIPLLNETALAKEMTGNGKSGFVFNARAKEALQEMIEQVMTLQNNFGEMIVAGRNYVKEQTLEKWAKSMVEELNNYYTNC